MADDEAPDEIQVPDQTSTEVVPFVIHPRAFKALGTDLVTSDLVAIIELVKNSYDAGASKVTIRFNGGDLPTELEIDDNGSGMSRAVLKDAFCTVATPYRLANTSIGTSNLLERRVSGEKGLGRLSAARLGRRFELVTQTEAEGALKLDVDWDSLAASETMSSCTVTISRSAVRLTQPTGTRIRISPLRAVWTPELIEDLRHNLSRLLPPFGGTPGFGIELSRPGLYEDLVELEPPDFLSHPKYAIAGTVDEQGAATYVYTFHAISSGKTRAEPGVLKWSQVAEDSKNPTVRGLSTPGFGPFSFDIRAWDIAPGDTEEISERFEIKRASVRADIKAYKGISLYRDGILVLPKSEGARDWLGLDLRRVGRVGPRLSTTQIVGHIALTAGGNPKIEDTSDRERLVSSPEVLAFEEILRSLVSLLENQRQKDRTEQSKSRKIVELFKDLNAKDLLSDVSEMAREGGPASDALPLVEQFSHRLDRAREELEQRFLYYSRLASVGTMAQYLVHEVRNRTTILGSSLRYLGKHFSADSGQDLAQAKLRDGLAALDALDAFAQKLAPLANRQFQRGARKAVVEDAISACLSAMSNEIKDNEISVSSPQRSQTTVQVDPGELEIILFNLLSNSVYWLSHRSVAPRLLEISINKVEGDKRAEVHVHDSGPGVPKDEQERIFLPGVTTKPNGFGMGLTAAGDLVDHYGGHLALDKNPRLGGASFVFDLPLA